MGRRRPAAGQHLNRPGHAQGSIRKRIGHRRQDLRYRRHGISYGISYDCYILYDFDPESLSRSRVPGASGRPAGRLFARAASAGESRRVRSAEPAGCRPRREPRPPIRNDGHRIDAAQLSGPGPGPGDHRGRCPTVWPWPECPLPAARPSVDCDTLARTHWQPACPAGPGPTGPQEFRPSQPEPEWPGSECPSLTLQPSHRNKRSRFSDICKSEKGNTNSNLEQK